MSSTKPTLETLPAELKVRIADMCQLQDDRLSQTLAIIAEEVACSVAPDASGGAKIWEERYEQKPWNSLSQLFQVSRSWHDAVVSVCFRELNSATHLDKNFLSSIGPRYGHVVNSLVALTFGHVTRSSVSNFLSALPLLNNLQHIVIGSTRRLAERLVQEDPRGWTGHDAVPYVEAAISRLLARVTSVSICLDGVDDTLSLCSGAMIAKLCVDVARPRDFVALNNALRSCSALCELKLALHCKSSASGALITSTDPTPDVFSPPSLRRLHVTSMYHSSGLVLVIAQLGQWSTCLSLDIPCNYESTSFFPEGAGWPNVRTLVLSARYDPSETTTASILRNVTPAVFPRLERLVCSIGSDTEGAKADRLRALRSLIGARAGSAVPLDILLETEDFKVGSTQFDLVDKGATGHSARVRVEYAVTSDSPQFALGVDEPFWSTDVNKADNDIHRLHQMMERLLRHTAGAADQALAVGDRRRLERMVWAAAELEYLRIEERC